MIDIDNLKRLADCPFCGDTPILEAPEFPEKGEDWNVHCANVCAANPSVFASTAELAIAGWNKRTTSPQTAPAIADEADMFWDTEDAEAPQDSPREIIVNSYPHGHIAEIICAQRGPNLFAFTWPQAHSDDDDTYVFFTLEEAEAKLKSLGPLPEVEG